MKTSELIGHALDFAVARATYGTEFPDAALLDYVLEPEYGMEAFEPSTNWTFGGPIIEREHIGVYRSSGQWIAEWWPDNSGMARNPAQRFQHNRYTCGPTPLVAAMRTYVAIKLGDEVEVPAELKD